MNDRAPGFWRQQFQSEATRPQVAFDAVLGVVAPIGCLVFDPIVFVPTPYIFNLSSYRGYAYAAIFFEVAALAAWLWTGRRTPWLGGLYAGVFAAGALVSLAIGVPMLPASVIGFMMSGVGVLGFTPFLTCLVYARNAVRAQALARRERPRARIAAFMFGAATVAAVTHLASGWLAPVELPLLILGRTPSLP